MQNSIICTVLSHKHDFDKSHFSFFLLVTFCLTKVQQPSFLMHSFTDCLLVSFRMCDFFFFKQAAGKGLNECLYGPGLLLSCCREAVVVAGPFPQLAVWSL